jgi:hypothetical protein
VLFTTQRTEGSAEFLDQRRQEDTAIREFLTGKQSREQAAHDQVVLQPEEERIVGLEVEQFLEDGQAEHLAVVHFGWWAPPGDQFPFMAFDLGLGQGIVEGTVDGGDQIVETERGGSGHGSNS